MKDVEDDTPMMRQYQSIKKEHPGAILFFRMGDFYEMFNEDAVSASRILEITLTSRNKKKSNPTPMCGVPHHAANSYIARLVKSGKKVAICEQMEDPKTTKGLVKRSVVRIVTPGTVLDENLLDPKSNHFLTSVYANKECVGLAILDMTTGLFQVAELNGSDSAKHISEEIYKLDPREIIVPESMTKNDYKQWSSFLNSMHIQTREDWTFGHTDAIRLLSEHFKTHSLDGFGCSEMSSAVCAAGALLRYVQETQKCSLEHILSLSTFNVENYMALDQTAVKSLELAKSSDGNRKTSLLGLLDRSLTPMGARRIKDWVLKPLINLFEIQKRHNIVEGFISEPLIRSDLRGFLKQVLDIERLLARISLSFCTARDLIALKTSIIQFPRIHNCIAQSVSQDLQDFLQTWDNLEDVYEVINENIIDDPPFNLKEGNIIKTGFNKSLDHLKSLCKEGKNWIASLEKKERERTGIPSLKIGYNKIYGYYIEVTKKHLDRVPDAYIRKQSLVNAERFISPELKHREEEITGTEVKIKELEHELFQNIRQLISKQGKRIQEMAKIVGDLDSLAAFAEIAQNLHYVRPEMNEGEEIHITSGRHPLIEILGTENEYIPNDTMLDNSGNQIMIITGPNMAGKSTYLRQVALISLMAQIGSFVPAENARLGVVDRIFSRVGAQDNLLKGQSTFMVEMNETANILNNATSKSLIILDEIGRGTSTFDGISIAWSIVEFLNDPNNIGAKTLFATHYHELTDLAALFPGIKNYNVQVKEWSDKIIFLRKIAEGGADKSYGIQVARLAGLPERILKRAKEVLLKLESKELDKKEFQRINMPKENLLPEEAIQMNLFKELNNSVTQKLIDTDPETLTPRQALDLIFDLKKIIKGSRS